ncbi:hypothetical protein Vafri_21969 [Volvox africanus]|uniref:Protein kinase domain-containing protein n=1 Tax=Volvox africanus TaxID=51714 RepID=A0A8J4BV23_9CHLO|nr:hypothetical protein Vafri_21969 [Volvox africanus]
MKGIPMPKESFDLYQRFRTRGCVIIMLIFAPLMPAKGFMEEIGFTKANNMQLYAGGDLAALCSTGGDLAAAFANTTVQFVYLVDDIVVNDADWAPFNTPITLWRNTTVSGLYSEAERWPMLDLNFRLNKIRLGPGVTLTFTQVAIRNWRRGIYFQAPGFDLVANSPDSASSGRGGPQPAGLLLLRNVALVQRTCLPESISRNSTSSLPRPPELPGEQSNSRLPQSPSCINSTSAPAMMSCWAAVGLYWDLAMYGYNFNEKLGPERAGYNLWFLNCHYKCETVLSEDCIRRYTPIFCYLKAFPDAVASNGTATVTTATTATGGDNPQSGEDDRSSGGGGGGGGGGGNSSKLLAPLLGGLLGGCAVVALGIGVLFVLWRRNRQLSIRGRYGVSSEPHDGPAKEGLEERSMASEQDAAGIPRPPPPAKAAAAAPSPQPRKLQPPVGATVKRHDAGGNVAGAAADLDSDRGGGDLSGNTGNLAIAAITTAAQAALAGSTETGFAPLCGPDLSSVGASRPFSGVLMVEGTPAPGESGGGGGGEEEGGQRSAAACTNRFWSQTGLKERERSGSLTAIPKLHCTSDELALLPVTPYTPLQPGINLNSQTVGATVKLLPVTLGKGAFGRVVEGMYGGKRVAVKLLNTGLLTGVEEVRTAVTTGEPGAQEPSLHGRGKTAWKALVQEVEVLGRCQHPNIVKLLAASLMPPRVCLVMELMDTSLDRLLHGVEGRMLHLDTVLHIAVQVARALSYLHPTVLHRDLKPANILISQPQSDRPVAKLADFGVSRLQTTVHATKNTEVGTAPYVAPESFDALNPSMTDRAEIYSFGVILWELLTGKRPWQGSSTAQISFAVAVHHDRLPLGDVPEERCPPKVRSLVVACWRRDPARRPAAAEVVKSLVLAQEAMLTASGSPAYSAEGPASSLGLAQSIGPKSADPLPR